LHNFLLQAHLKATLADAQPKLLKELAKINTMISILDETVFCNGTNNKALAIIHRALYGAKHPVMKPRLN